MSEYMEKHSVSRLIGAPPGYVGFEAGCQLTEEVRRKPYSVLLFDEIEKAHSDVINVMLQILDEGHVTDGQGRTVNFRNTLIIMTSNIGSQAIIDLSDDHTKKHTLDEIINDSLRQYFKPEFLNRIDESIIFKNLDKGELRQIVSLQITRLAKRLESQKLKLELSNAAIEWIASYKIDPAYGARPIKRTIQRELETPIAKSIIKGEYQEGETIKIDIIGDKLIFN